MHDSLDSFDMPETTDVAWCPGCGNFKLLSAMKRALTDLDIDRTRLVMVSGIGQAGKAPQYLNTNMFNGLHGRALPAALGIRLANPELTVVVESGDGDIYGEGGNHFLHTIRRNPDITVIVHDNMVYGLTKGQGSPTSCRGMVTPVQVRGVVMEPFNPAAVAIAMNAPFVARAYAGNEDETASIIMEAIRFRGTALVDVLQPCVVFNSMNTYAWFGEHTRHVPEEHDPGDRTAAFALATAEGPIPLGILYRKEGRETYEELACCGRTPLHLRKAPDEAEFQNMLDLYR
ncbi:MULTISPECIES: thiamine pyrophosphate-dependent enzyme [Chlorobium/Pelodictyon group]|uniref:2-oxoacid:acceptor oxidoreductase, beta subunit, pyruvate/2-ketoisovalerate n=1 Tax=Chlorobium luteolum (strain DSM 273 / BCRC 81028 / 2530) TaxID=319225 RepID=Q3B3Z6_CHLL3|nr:MULTISPECIES: thiamine pyrophosphate-dependent enzyme [Chlorobium/Pelodictyon group]ABB23935.1 2-oxoacid:acceptor oxidoreductase, beta subunit, pyruvate/2-ketoisovalerate [Pelodictyon luteolum DSM 273]TCD47411.1 2-oxoacid ferredoxin oxidoreductase [Chlorobium sp. N1]